MLKCYSNRGISTLEVLIAFAATAVFVSVSAPLSRDLGVRLRVLESLEILGEAQEALVHTCTNNPEAVVNSNLEAGFLYIPAGNSEDHLSNVLLGADCAKGEMVIHLWTAETGATPDPVIEVSATGHDGDAWVCRLLQGQPQHVPKICRNQYARAEG